MTGHDDTRRAHPGYPAADEPLPSGTAEPVDVAQVRADEALVEALRRSAEVRVDDPIDDQLAGLLQAWRDDVDDEPVVPVDMDAVMAALTPAPRRRRSRFAVAPLASAAAVIMVAFVGIGVAASGASPGDALWSVSKVLYSDRAESIEAAATVREKLGQASAALDSGNVGRAYEALEQAKQTLPGVTQDGDKQQLEDEASELENKIMEEVTGGVTAPQTPVPAAPTSTGTSQPQVPQSSAPATTPPTTSPPSAPATTTQTTSPVEPTTEPPSVGGSPGETGGAGIGGSSEASSEASSPSGS